MTLWRAGNSDRNRKRISHACCNRRRETGSGPHTFVATVKTKQENGPHTPVATDKDKQEVDLTRLLQQTKTNRKRTSHACCNR